MGPHVTTSCPVCQGTAVGSPTREHGPGIIQERAVICCQQFHTSWSAGPFEEVDSRDRILVNKWLKPRRWDILVFRVPDDPSTNYAMRLVGLPGEEVVIRDGAVWIDGKKLDPPEPIRGLRYTTTFEFSRNRLGSPSSCIWGSEDHPAFLYPDEYFVLGDFSENSRDSRLWEFGAEGHLPYALPESHIIGVVTHLYWPVGRWRAFR